MCLCAPVPFQQHLGCFDQSAKYNGFIFLLCCLDSYCGPTSLHLLVILSLSSSVYFCSWLFFPDLFHRSHVDLEKSACCEYLSLFKAFYSIHRTFIRMCLQQFFFFLSTLSPWRWLIVKSFYSPTSLSTNAIVQIKLN